MIDRDKLRAAALDEARRVIGNAIEYRRNHPYTFYLFHLKMEQSYKRRGRRVLAWWHRVWRRRYWAKAKASAEAGSCERHKAHED